MRSTGPGQPAHLVLDVLEILDRSGIPYAVLGALAVSFHGAACATDKGEVTAWLRGRSQTPEELEEELRRAGLDAGLERPFAEDPNAWAIFIGDAHANRVDLFHGLAMDPEASARTVAATLLDSPVRLISAEDLIAMKIYAGGFQDLEDARSILHVSGARLDLALLKRLARRYGPAEARLAKLLKETPR